MKNYATHTRIPEKDGTLINALKVYLQSLIDPQEFTVLFGRGRRFSGVEWINIYRLDGLLYVQVYNRLSPLERDELKTFLFENFPGMQYSMVDRSSNTPEMIYLSPSITEDYVYTERGLKYYLDLRRPSHPGLFFDIEPARSWVRDNSKGKRVLNLFAFTCAFSVCALQGGAEEVINMDNNSNILNRGRNNHRLNGMDHGNVRFEKKDVMKSFGYLDKKGPFDLIICDPPSFQKGSFTAEKNYPKMVRRLKNCLTPQGILMLCLNDPFLGFDFLEEIIAQEELTEVRRIDPAEDFIQADPDRGLKIICVQKS